MGQWERFAAGEGFEVARRQGAVRCRLRTAPTLDAIASLRAAIRGPGGRCVVIVHIAATARLPDAQTRKAAIHLMKVCAEHIEAWIAILEGSGLMRSAFRSVANTARLIARPGFPLQVVDSAHAAAQWLAAESSARLGVDELAWLDTEP